jgi:hypothetical protein
LSTHIVFHTIQPLSENIIGTPFIGFTMRLLVCLVLLCALLPRSGASHSCESDFDHPLRSTQEHIIFDDAGDDDDEELEDEDDDDARQSESLARTGCRGSAEERCDMDARFDALDAVSTVARGGSNGDVLSSLGKAGPSRLEMLRKLVGPLDVGGGRHMLT